MIKITALLITILIFITLLVVKPIESEASYVISKKTYKYSQKIKPTKIPKRVITSTPTPRSVQSTTGPISIDSTTFILNEINNYRITNGLPPVETNTQTCTFAKIRAEEISKNFNHDGFKDRVNNNTLPYSSYSSVTENIAMNSNYKNVVQSWINSPGHAENMKKDTPFVCVYQYGNYFAYEGLKP